MQQPKLKKKLDYIYRQQREIITLNESCYLVKWDQETNMPPAGISDCSEKISLLSELAHKKLSAKELKSAVGYLKKADNFSKLSKNDKLVVRRLASDIEKASKLPPEFVAKLAKLTSEATKFWKKAKNDDNFKIFQPYLEKIVRMKKEECKLRSIPGHPYNSLLDIYEEGMDVNKLAETFKTLRKELVKLLKKIQSAPAYRPKGVIKGNFDITKQAEINNFVVRLLNLPGDKTRLDISAHPFTTRIGSDDVRITTRYDSKNPFSSLFSTIHEAGHALYYFGIPKNYSYTVLFDAPSFGMHESQSRFWENMIGKSKNFWQCAFPIYKKKFPKQLKNVSFDEWFRLVNLVKPSFIRVEADELTYYLHIILRFEIEKGLIEGSIKVKDLPKIWNEKFEEMFGIKPKTDREGVLQDVHWSWGDFGYFPTYALGTIYAAQLYSRMLKEKPQITDEIRSGKLDNVLFWLRENVHKYGKSITAEEIIRKTCKEGLNPEVYIKYLSTKYSKIYNLV